MATGIVSDEQRFVLDGVPWSGYTGILEALEGRAVRVTYLDGELELRTVSHEHEHCAHLVGRLVNVLTEELALPVKGGGRTTLQLERRHVGLDPEACYWLAGEPAVRGRNTIDLERDPPPDVALDVSVTPSAMDRLAVFAALRVPEVWVYDGAALRVYRLAADGALATVDRSPTFPAVPLDELAAILRRRGQSDETSLVREFRFRVREPIRG